MSGKKAFRICGVCGLVGTICSLVSMLTSSKAQEYEIGRIMDEKYKELEKSDDED